MKKAMFFSPSMVRRFWFVLLLALCSSFWLQTVSAAAPVTVTGRGADRQEALHDAMRLAVERSVGTLLAAETLVQNAAVVRDEIYTQAQGFVQAYTILDESCADGLWKVTASVTVDRASSSPLGQKLARVLLAQDPRVAVVVLDAATGAADAAGEGGIVAALQAYGFTRVSGSEALIGRFGAARFARLLEGTSPDALLSELGAEYLLVGRSRSECGGDVLEGYGDGRMSGLVSYRAHIDAKLLRAATGEVVAARGETAAAADIAAASGSGRALVAAGKKLGARMAEQLGTDGSKVVKSVRIIASLPAYARVAALQSALGRVAGVGNVYVRDYRANAATIDVDYANTAQALARALEKEISLRLVVEEVAQGLVRLRMD